MRFRELELRRYGRFDGHRLAFGDGKVDFHLIVGPNEAGKSTLLSAISDLLFGIPERTAYGFRHGMAEMELGAHLEHESQALRFIRRKKRKDPLADIHGNPLGDDALMPFLKGIDRPAFANMFGLSHDRLREGGRNILDGKDDAARVVLEAEGGLSGLGQLIADLEAEADQIFTAQGRTKLLNQRLKERDEALKRSRETAVDERTWDAVIAKRRALEADHAAAIERLTQIAERLAVLERIRRTRLPLARLDQRLAELEPLRSDVIFPEDADARKLEAETTIARLTGTQQTRIADLEAARLRAAGLTPPAEVLAARQDIEAVVAGRAIYVDRLAALPAKEAELAAVEASIERIRRGAEINGAVPSAVARDRLRHAAERFRVSDGERDRLEAERAKHASELAVRKQALAAMPEPAGIEFLRDLTEAAPRKIAEQQTQVQDAVEVQAERLRKSLGALLPWRSASDTLSQLPMPSTEVIDEFADRFADLEVRRRDANRDLSDAETRCRDAQARLHTLLSDSAAELPTRAAVEAARGARTTRWQGIRDRLLSAERQPETDAAAADAFEAAVEKADLLADRRHDEAERLAVHAQLTAEVEERCRMIDEAQERLGRLDREEAEAQSSWTALCTTIGFAEAVKPSRLRQWLDQREQALADMSAHEQARADYDRLCKAHQAHIDALRAALRQAKVEFDPGISPDAVVLRAVAALREFDQVRVERAKIAELVAKLERDLAHTDVALDASRESAATWWMAREAALVDVGLPAGADDIAVDAALSAFDDLERATAARDELSATVRAIRAELATLETRLDNVCLAVNRTRSADVLDDVRLVAGELTAALAAEADRQKTLGEIERLETAMADADQAMLEAQAVLEALAAAAGLADTAGLADAIASCRRRQRIEAEIAEIEDELAMAGEGLELTRLRADVAAMPAEATLSEIEALQRERQELDAAREGLRVDLAEALRQEREIGRGADAAQALQEAAEATAEAGEQAERYVAAKAAAALLKWSVARHRQTRAAPLLNRASAIMAEITDGSIAKLDLDYSDTDEPIITGLRPSGERLGVDAMSEGTRDQLYLALRLASVEERIALHPMPFICDDLLVNADDERAGLIFKGLHTLSRSTQVLCFTHHRHLVDVATRTIGAGNIHLHDLVPERAAA